MSIQANTKKHQDLIETFERIFEMFERISFKGTYRFDKEDKSMWAKDAVYQHGELNQLFKAFRYGVAYGIAVSQ